MLPNFLSPTSLFSIYLRRCFNSSGLSSQTINIDDETTIHFWGPKLHKTNQTQKPSLVLIHGFGPEALWQWRRQVQFFSSHFNIYVPNLVFFGGSKTTSSERSEIFQAICVGKLMVKFQVTRYSVMGTSYGGFVAYHMARMWPERVDKVVIASSGVNMKQSDKVKLLNRASVDKIEHLMLPTTPQQLRNLMTLAVFKTPKMLPDFLFTDMINKLYTENRREKMELLKGLTLGIDDKATLSPLEQEVLIIWGEHDQIFPLDLATELKGLLGNTTKLEVMKDTSHVPQIEDTSLFNDIVNNFLSKFS